MKNNILFPLIVLIVGGVAVFYFTRNTPDIRYNLSDSIPISFLSPTGNSEIIQILEVKNVGTESAKNVQVKINGEIIANKLDKYSNADEVKVFNDNKVFELVYPELPPQGGFKVTLKSQNSDINRSNLSVLYNQGVAQEAFIKKVSTDYLTSLSFLGYIIGALFFIYLALSEIKEFSLKNKEVTELLKLKKPIYIGDKKWKKLIVRALNYRIGGDYNRQGGIKFTESYELLSLEKPSYIIEEEGWSNLIEKAIRRFKELYKYKVSYSDSEELLKLLNETKPKYLPESDWSELLDKASKEYTSIKSRHIYDPNDILLKLKQKRPSNVREEFWYEYTEKLQKEYYELQKPFRLNVEELIVALKTQKPDLIKDEIWIKLSNDLRNSLMKRLEHEIYMTDTPFTYIQKIDLSVLEDKEQLSLKRSAYKNQFDNCYFLITSEEAKTFLSLPKPDWIKNTDYEILKLRAERIIEIEEEKAKTEQVRKEYQLKLTDLSVREKEIKDQSEEVSRYKNQIENQLEIINLVINEPEKINRIEDYSHSFAPGNFEDLMKIAELIKA
jgi:hypothetical protein